MKRMLRNLNEICVRMTKSYFNKRIDGRLLSGQEMAGYCIREYAEADNSTSPFYYSGQHHSGTHRGALGLD